MVTTVPAATQRTFPHVVGVSALIFTPPTGFGPTLAAQEALTGTRLYAKGYATYFKEACPTAYSYPFDGKLDEHVSVLRPAVCRRRWC